jgi:acyl carrier protein
MVRVHSKIPGNSSRNQPAEDAQPRWEDRRHADGGLRLASSCDEEERRPEGAPFVVLRVPVLRYFGGYGKIARKCEHVELVHASVTANDCVPSAHAGTSWPGARALQRTPRAARAVGGCSPCRNSINGGLVMDVTRPIEIFLLENVPGSRAKKSFDLDEDLLEQGAIDSVTLMQLVSFVEQEFRIDVSDEDLVIDNFRSIRSIQGLVDQKREART